MATYDVGDQVRVTASFKTAGVLTAIAGATTNATHRLPDGTDRNPAPSIETGSGTGIYYPDISLDQGGTHTIKIASTDVVVAAETIELVVAKSIFDHS